MYQVSRVFYLIFSSDQRGSGTVAVVSARGPVVVGAVGHAVGVARRIAVQSGESVEGWEEEGDGHWKYL